jgi:ATP-dependent DNA helicase RecG
LLGTTVVEVGLDIAAIPLMAVVNAQRFGLASLHQLRGRLARGPEASPGKCILFGSADSHHRLELLAACKDGFAVAAADLAERGPGALKGLRQHGRSDFQLFDPLLDHDLVDCLKLSEVRTWLLQLD